MGQTAHFGKLSEEYSTLKNARVVVIQVPYDHTSTWVKGSDKGPAAIIEASDHMELYDIETDTEVYKKGIYTSEAVDCQPDPEDMVKQVADQVRQHLKNDKFVVVLGGEHSVSIGSARAHIENNAEMTVLQFDAHSDLRDEYKGSRYNHACTMARIAELCPIVQVGIRSMDSSEKKVLDKDRVIFAREIPWNKNRIEKVLSTLSQNVYVTIDLDVFDPSIMPSTGTPEPGGLLWYDALDLMRTVFENRNVVGFDVVELCPNERNKAPDFLTAKLIYKLLSYKFRD
jgi:agmatinase